MGGGVENNISSCFMLQTPGLALAQWANWLVCRLPFTFNHALHGTLYYKNYHFTSEINKIYVKLVYVINKYNFLVQFGICINEFFKKLTLHEPLW